MRKLLTSLYWTLLLAAILAGVALIWVVATPAGSQWALQQLLTRNEIDLSVDEFSGSFLRGFSAKRLRYQNAAIAIAMTDFRSRYSLAALLDKKVYIKTLHASSVDITIKPHESNATQTGFRSPITLVVDDIRIDRLSVQLKNSHLLFRDNHATRLELQDRRLAFRRLESRFLQQGYSVAGELRFTQPLSADLYGTITTPQIPNPVHAAVHGKLDEYRISATTTIDNPALHAIKISVNGVGDLDGMKINALLMDMLDGEVRGKGNISWRNGVRATIDFDGDGLNPGVIHEAFPGRLRASGKAVLKDGQLSGNVSVSGEVRDYPLRFAGKAQWRNGVIALPSGKLEIDNNRLDFRGHVYPGNVAVLNASVDAPNLAAAIPGLRGSLSGKGKITGPLTNPVFTARLKATALTYQDISAGKSMLTIDPGVFAGEYAISGSAEQLQYNGQQIAHADLSGLVSLERQKATLRLVDGPLQSRIAARVQGAWDSHEKRWTGRIAAMEFSNRFLQTHRLRQPARLEISKNETVLSPLCLERARESICLDANFDRQQGLLANLSVAGVPLARLKTWVPETSRLKETIDASVKITGKDRLFHGAGKLTLDPSNGLQTELDFDLDAHSVQGDIRASFDRMEWLRLFNDDILSPRGKLTADIGLEGPIQNPRFSGEIKLRDGFARLPATGIELRKIALTTTINPEKSAIFSGSLHSGEGEITIEGNANWAYYPQWWMTLDARGENFLAANLPEAKVQVSPDLKIAASRDGMGVSGDVSIPKASIELGNLQASGITPTQDEIILGEPRRKNEVPWPFIANIRLVLGDDVLINGYGLKSRLGGELIISQRSDTAVDADGVIRLIDGEYKAYGQQLKIEKGNLYFNGPLRAPRLGIRALRDIPDNQVKVGLELRGTLQQPQSSVFSIPAMEETDALAYLLTGKPLSGLGEGDSNLLLNAAVRLGLKSSAGSLDKLRKKAGLDTFAIQPGQDYTDSALILGKYLTPRLYIQYATKLFAESESFLLKYRLSSKLHLEAESGDENQSMDLIYELETN